MKNHGLLTRAAAVAAMSAAIAAPAVVGLTAGIASAKPMCEIAFERAAYAADQYWTAVDAGQPGEAGFWKKEHGYARADLKRLKCGY